MATRTDVGWIRGQLKAVPLDEKKEPDCDDMQTAEDCMGQFTRDRLNGTFDEDVELMWDD